MELSIRLINKIKGAPRRQKAVAIALCLKYRCDRDSIVRNYNPNKIANLINIAPTTFKSYLPLMVEMGLVRYDGANNEHLVVCCLRSSHKSRNIDVHRINFKSYKEAYNGLRAFLLLRIQKRKDFVRRTLQLAFNPMPWDDCKSARKKVKSLVRQGIIRGAEYIEKGLSYKHLAKEVGNCIRTAQNIVQYAIDKKWWKKEKHSESTYMPNIRCREYEGFTFTTRNYAYVVYANTYTLSRGIKKCL